EALKDSKAEAVSGLEARGARDSEAAAGEKQGRFKAWVVAPASELTAAGGRRVGRAWGPPPGAEAEAPLGAGPPVEEAEAVEAVVVEEAEAAEAEGADDEGHQGGGIDHE